MNEIQLAEKVARYYSDFETYKEQQLPSGRCDIVVKSGKLITTVECKTGFSPEVIRQAMAHRPFCNYSFVAVPTPKSKNNHYAAKCICQEMGIGILYVNPKEFSLDGKVYEGIGVSINLEAKYRRAIGAIILDEKQKLAIAGAQNNSQSAFKITIKEIEEKIKWYKKTGVALSDLFGKNTYHWSSPQSARQCLSSYVRKGILPQFRIEDGIIFLKSVQTEITTPASVFE